MTRLTAETVWRMSDEELLRALDGDAFERMPRRVRFYAPSFMYYKTSHYCSSPKEFPTISVTGSGCALKCKHCGGRVLDTMYPVATAEELFVLCSRLKQDGALGCLISGGCLPNGSVPVGRYVEAIRRVKRELGLTVLVHTGIIDRETASALKESGVDTALIDIIGSDETIKQVYNLNVSLDDYDRSLEALADSGIAFVPHVIVGLHYGKLQGESKALGMISKYSPSALVVIAFMPIHGTEMEHVEPPSSIDVVRVIAAARVKFPRTPLVLGCMRPKGRHRDKTDVLAVRAGVDAIAFPAEEAIRFAETHGCNVSFSSLCCSQIYADLAELHVRG